jgi:hypothetical protein
MFIVGLIGWWYGPGWRQRVSMATERLAQTADFFSIDLLARTLFSPFRQISAGGMRGPLGVQMRAFFDRLLSRFIGAGIRTVLIIFGFFALLFTALLNGLMIIVWAFVPLLPVVGLILALMGWLPWR